MLIISVTEQSHKSPNAYWGMTAGQLINVHCLWRLMTHASWVNFDCISLLPCPRLVSRNLGRWVWAHTLRVYKVSTKTGRGSLAKRRLCLGPVGVINCTPLSALSWVNLFPRKRGYNKLCIIVKWGRSASDLKVWPGCYPTSYITFTNAKNWGLENLIVFSIFTQATVYRHRESKIDFILFRMALGPS